jgi:HAD superfamily phosphoserine phosphatase-like hydrolase
MTAARPRPVDLVAFDVDGTLIESEEGLTVWEVLNRRFIGSSEINAKRYAMYRRGELSYPEWVSLDIRGWRDRGATRADLVEALSTMYLRPGARETLSVLRESGLRLVVISGTLDLLLETLLPDHPFHEVHANHIGFDAEGRISHWRATPFDMQGKAKLLRAIAMREGVPLARCAFVGDSDNDVWVAREAGLTVAVHPRSAELERLAGAVVRSGDLRDILPHLLLDTAPPDGPA